MSKTYNETGAPLGIDITIIQPVFVNLGRIIGKLSNVRLAQANSDDIGTEIPQGASPVHRHGCSSPSVFSHFPQAFKFWMFDPTGLVKLEMFCVKNMGETLRNGTDIQRFEPSLIAGSSETVSDLAHSELLGTIFFPGSLLESFLNSHEPKEKMRLKLRNSGTIPSTMNEAVALFKEQTRISYMDQKMNVILGNPDVHQRTLNEGLYNYHQPATDVYAQDRMSDFSRASAQSEDPQRWEKLRLEKLRLEKLLQGMNRNSSIEVKPEDSVSMKGSIAADETPRNIVKPKTNKYAAPVRNNMEILPLLYLRRQVPYQLYLMTL